MTAVRVSHDNARIIQLLTHLPSFHFLCVSFSEKKGHSDSESIGGSLESLSSTGELTYVLVSPACPLRRTLQRDVAEPLIFSFSAMWEYITPAHTTRRLPKPASTLTISSDDLNDRDIASESDWFKCVSKDL